MISRARIGFLGIAHDGSERKRRGRPPEAPSERKRGNVTVRVRDRLYDRLTSEAAGGQRSISEEIERGLESYYEMKDTYGELARFVGTAVKTVEKTEGRPWYADNQMRLKVRAAIEAVLDFFVGPRLEKGKSGQTNSDLDIWEKNKAGRDVGPLFEGKLLDLNQAMTEIDRGKLWLDQQIKALDVLQEQLQKLPPEELEALRQMVENGEEERAAAIDKALK